MVFGYAADFIAARVVGVPVAPGTTEADRLGYTHFSVTMNPARRLAWWVAWNIDGYLLFPEVSRESGFYPEQRIPAATQTLEAVYADNNLDRGHLARRADLLWGTTYAKAVAANHDSFCFTNITPQIDTFNQASRGGVWGQLENAVLELEGLSDRRIGVFAGPVLANDDPDYRGLVQIPVEHWKIVLYRINDQTRFRCFVLSQDLSGLGAGFLDGFATYQVAPGFLSQHTRVAFPGLDGLHGDPTPASR